LTWFLSGNGIDRNVAEAITMIKSGCNAEDGTGLFDINWMNHCTKRFQQHNEEAQRDNMSAMSIIGHCYQYCIGVDPDPSKANKWYHRGALLGCDHCGTHFDHPFHFHFNFTPSFSLLFVCFQQ
jgi:TPR repeat protein